MQEEALRVVDAHVLDPCEGLRSVDELGDRFETHDPRHVDEAPDGGRIERVVDQAPDELPVDLQAIETSVFR